MPYENESAAELQSLASPGSESEGAPSNSSSVRPEVTAAMPTASADDFNKFVSKIAVAPGAASTQTADPQQQAMWQQALQALAAGTNLLQPPSSVGTAPQSLLLPAQQPQPVNTSASVVTMPNVMGSTSSASGATSFGNSSTLPGQSGSVLSRRKRPAENPTDTDSVQKIARQAPLSIVSLTSGEQPPPQQLEELARQHPNWDTMTPAERRRQERNLREQQRSYLISQQIKKLRDVLTESNVPFKPNKFSILVSVVDYIKSLQARAVMLDSEHRKLLDTIKGTSDMVAGGKVPDGSEIEHSHDKEDPKGLDILLVQGIEYRSVFQRCPFAMGVASLDGRILACNEAFQNLLSLGKPSDTAATQKYQSFFVYIRNHQDVFDAMADLLKRSSVASETGEGVVKEEHLLYWCGRVVSLKSQQLFFNITLTSTSDGNPNFFGLSAAVAPTSPG